MHQREYIAAKDGNVSVRIGDSRILVTPTSCRKATVKERALIVCRMDGSPLPGQKGRPSSELDMHLAIYHRRPEVRGIVHAHPPVSIAHSVAGLSLREPLLPEALCELGEVLTLPYSTPTTQEVPQIVSEYLSEHNCLVLERHGTVTMGHTLAEAYDRLEILEHTAKISLMSHLLKPGGVTALTGDQRAKLAALGC